MGARRPTYTQLEQDKAAEVAGLLLVGASTGEIALSLVELLPVSLASDAVLAGDVLEAATLLVRTLLPDESGFGGAGRVEQAARTERLVRRGFYAVVALRRLARAAQRGGPQELSAQITLERSYLTYHVEEGERLVEGARKVDLVRELYGGIAGWYHLNPTDDPRPHHIKAHGKNFRVDIIAPPVETTSWPGTERYCGCEAGPPHRGGEVMLAA